MRIRLWILCISGLIFHEWVSAQEAALTVYPDLFARTFPEIQLYGNKQFPGPLLYPDYGNLKFQISFAGTKDLVAETYRKLIQLERDTTGAIQIFLIDLRRLNENKILEEVEFDRRNLLLNIIDQKDPDSISLYFELEIPVQKENWPEGQYQVEIGMWYSFNGIRKTIGDKLNPFEIRYLQKGGGDEINLLSNSWINKPENLAARINQSKEYSGQQIFDRVLELQPQDAWARHMLAQKYLREGKTPELSIRLYEEVLQLFRDGKAKRVTGLLDPFQSLNRGGTVTRESMISLIESKIEEAKVVSGNIREGEKQAKLKFATGGLSGLIGIIKSQPGQKLWQIENAWEAIWAIRMLGEQKKIEAHSVLVEELRKLEGISLLLQTEICSALASIHSNDKTINSGTMLKAEWEEAVNWWLARPEPGDVGK